METQAKEQAKEEKVQSGKQVAFGIVAFLIGTSLLLLAVKYLIG